MSRTRNMTVRTPIAACLGAAVVALGLVGATVGATATATPASAGAQNLPGVPEPGSSASVWKGWAADELAEARSTDWDADSTSRGCELKDVSVTMEVDAAYNAAMGAPDGLRTVRVDLEESCDTSAPAKASGTSSKVATTSAASLSDDADQSLPTGNQCRSTSGPGTMCLSESSGRVYASWKYSGSGSVTGFLRIYQVPTSTSGCPTGSTWLTGESASWSSGTTRTISKTQTQNGGYSAHIWKKATLGHTDWGGACGVL